MLDVFLARSDTPTPVVFCIHGGGWVNGDKSGYRGSAQKFLDAGLSVVAINYRYTSQRDKLLPKIDEYSPLSHVTSDDPPAYLDYKVAPKKGESQADPTHAAMYGEILMAKWKEKNVQGFVSWPGHEHPKYTNTTEYLMDTLKK